MVKELLQEIGYDEISIEKIMKWYSAYLEDTLYRYILDTFEYFEKKSYSKKDIVKMTKLLPAIFGLSEENLNKKIEFYKEIDLEIIVMENTMRLMQSVELTYARYRFLNDLGININQDNYRKLFYDQKAFAKQYGITNKELLNRYSYNQKVLIKGV